MKKILIFIITIMTFGCSSEKQQIKQVATFTGQQVTGVTVSEGGIIFANFPRWRKGVAKSVVKVAPNGSSTAYPNASWNDWELGKLINDSVFVAVQSVVAHENILYVLDTRNPVFGGVIDNPKIFAFDITSNTLLNTYELTANSFHKDSYINDLRIDKKKNKMYLTDSGHAGLIIVDLNSGSCKRVLDNHVSTLAETDHLNFDGKKWTNTVHSDGIALDTQNDLLYYHALTGYNLYAVPTDILIQGDEKEIQSNVKFIAKTPAPDGMIFDKNGNLYLADLEQQKIMKVNVSDGTMEVLAEGDQVKWADTFSIYDGELYYTNSRINEASGSIDTMIFDINKINIEE